jgi:hypothetical protein
MRNARGPDAAARPAPAEAEPSPTALAEAALKRAP